ncbi:putative quinol monooxygenase [Spirillospora sp. NPDC049024]
MTVAMARLEAVPGRADEVEAALAEVAERTAREPGAVAYSVVRHDQVRFLVYEEYVDQAACDAHFTAPYVQDLLERLADLLVAAPQVDFGSRVAGFRASTTA